MNILLSILPIMQLSILPNVLTDLFSPLLHAFAPHSDVKAANILLDAKGCVKLADYGLCSFLPAGKALTLDPGGYTKGYTAPERRATSTDNPHPFSCPTSDIWSLGIEFTRLYRRVPTEYRQDYRPDAVPTTLSQLAESCFAEDPRSRISAWELGSALTAWAEGRFALAEEVAVKAHRRASAQTDSGHGIIVSTPLAMDALIQHLGTGDADGTSPVVSTILFSSDSDISTEIMSDGGLDCGLDSAASVKMSTTRNSDNCIQQTAYAAAPHDVLEDGSIKRAGVRSSALLEHPGRVKDSVHGGRVHSSSSSETRRGQQDPGEHWHHLFLLSSRSMPRPCILTFASDDNAAATSCRGGISL